MVGTAAHAIITGSLARFPIDILKAAEESNDERSYFRYCMRSWGRRSKSDAWKHATTTFAASGRLLRCCDESVNTRPVSPSDVPSALGHRGSCASPPEGIAGAGEV